MNQLRVMTYNMLFAPGDRLNPLVQTVRQVNPDIVACQEIISYDGLMALSRELNMIPVCGPANTPEAYEDLDDKHYEHVALLTRFPVLETRIHRGDVEAMFRSILEVRVQIPEWQAITFYVVHFRAIRHPNMPHLKMRETAAFLSVVNQCRGPFIALGDFNALAPGESEPPSTASDLPEDHIYAVYGGVIGAIQRAGLVDSYRHVNPYDGTPVSTFLSSTSSRVDYIWTSPDLVGHIENSEIRNDDLVQVASDHRPVVTDFHW